MGTYQVGGGGGGATHPLGVGTGQPGVSIMLLGGVACGPMACYPSEAAL